LAASSYILVVYLIYGIDKELSAVYNPVVIILGLYFFISGIAPLASPQYRTFSWVAVWIIIMIVLLVAAGAIGGFASGDPNVYVFVWFIPICLGFIVGVALILLLVDIAIRALTYTATVKSEWPIIAGMLIMVVPLAIVIAISVLLANGVSLATPHIGELLFMALVVVMASLVVLVSLYSRRSVCYHVTPSTGVAICWATSLLFISLSHFTK
jgi:hypothetical protein